MQNGRPGSSGSAWNAFPSAQARSACGSTPAGSYALLSSRGGMVSVVMWVYRFGVACETRACAEARWCVARRVKTRWDHGYYGSGVARTIALATLSYVDRVERDRVHALLHYTPYRSWRRSGATPRRSRGIPAAPLRRGADVSQPFRLRDELLPARHSDPQRSQQAPPHRRADAVDLGGRSRLEPHEPARFRAVTTTFAEVADQAAHHLARGDLRRAGAQAEDHSAFVGGRHQRP